MLNVSMGFCIRKNTLTNGRITRKDYKWGTFRDDECLLSWLWCYFISMYTYQNSAYCAFSSVQSQSCLTLCDPVNRITPKASLSITISRSSPRHLHQVSDAIQPSHPLASPSPLAPNPSQHQSLFQWVNSSHEVTQVLEFQL